MPRPAYYAIRGRAQRDPMTDPAADAVAEAYGQGRGVYGAGKMKAFPARGGIVPSRRRICRIMREKGPVGAYARTRFKSHPPKADAAEVPNIVNREFDGHPPRTHIAGDPAYVRVGARWRCICLLVDPCNRGISGHSAGERKDARLVKSAFATLDFPLDEIEVFHTDRGPSSIMRR